MSTPRPSGLPNLPSYESAQALAEKILGIDGVAELRGGRFGEVALLYPRHKVIGLRLDDAQGHQTLEVNVAAYYGYSLTDLAQSIVAAVTDSGLCDAASIDVVVSDVVKLTQL
ncbi:Asp23/Gls24 family envelope stress response protein [Corynebacterium pseudotuberculosis]|uniref:Asp23/Gls24 family envelope stress response protein n=2 Tax=Corynebacterium pseudotuberculosis TaxID=1719 RepID=D9QEB6_CORP2|nr:Asp23/Gls24 family envelope stress response protein [Corynebacterium pseudotuberculosis]AER68438.1 Hypothetical protein Cp106_0334 [Corynebacterium pseudotuberculosis 1/06-A]ADK28135.1 Asp23/Gls24 family envelope stress response protein [Corynebacterium pseudotuberculosis FRC41]ADL09839.1 Asp23/Gls24 family envelope stress response protein [Corynebacterium pseudotuberculosis C231]ADL20246.1 Asp23/Gls24 family envelope stress response protein [Corynebacterium pseudotuberculosis 1002]ADO25632